MTAEGYVRQGAYDFAVMLHDIDRETHRQYAERAELNLFAMRRKLKELDPVAPRDEWDGNAWATYLGLQT